MLRCGTAGSVRIKKRSALRRAEEILLYNMDRQSNDVCLIMRQHDLLPICAADDMQSLLGVTFEQLRQDVMLLADALEDGQKDVSVWKKCCRHRALTRSRSRRHTIG